VETEYDEEAVNLLIQDKRQDAHNIWKSVTTSDTPNNKSISAFVNQAILAHSSVIGKEIGVKYGEEIEEVQISTGKKRNTLYCPKCRKEYDLSWKVCLDCRSKLKEHSTNKTVKQKKSNIALGEAHWKNWRFVINRFSTIVSQDLFWEYVGEKARKTNDPRLSRKKIQEIHEHFVADISEPNFAFISRALSCKDYERVKRHSSLLNGSTISADVLRGGFNQILSEQNRTMSRYSELAETDLLKVEKEQKNSAKKVINIYTRLVDNVTDVVYEGNIVDINSVSDFVIARDKLAKVARNSAIALNNVLVSDKLNSQKEIINNYNCAHDMIRKALEFAGSSYIRQKYEKDEELIRKNLEMTRVYNSYTQQQASPKTSGFNWKAIIGWGAVILFYVIVANLPDDSSNKGTTRSTSSYKSKSSSTQPSLYQLKTRIENLATSIKAKESKLAELESSIKFGNSRLESLETELNTLNSRMKNAWFGKDKLIDEYNKKVNQYNALQNKYNPIYTEYKQVYNKYKQEVTTHDKLVESYNKRIR